MTKKRTTTDLIEIMHHRYYEGKPERLAELEEFKDREIVVHCKMGGRSQKAAEQLQAAGFTKLHNLAGGITAWSERVDPKVAKY